jgi:uncharacterized protein (DUF983 family)
MIAPESKQRLDKLSIRVIESLAEELKKERCPECSGSLSISFHPEGPAQGSVCIICQPCVIKIWIDGVARVPPWVAVAGSRIQT